MITPYSKYTTRTLWCDPYISKQLLKAHLNPDINAASRTKETINKTVEFLTNKFQPKSMADFGCGPGLYTNLFQNNGITSSGVDISINSLEYARMQNPNITYINESYIDYKLDKPVDLITWIYCDFGAMLPPDLTKTLKNIHNSLHDDGVFFFDVFSMNFFKKQKESYKQFEETDGFYMEGTCNITEESILYKNMGLVLTHIEAKGSKEHSLYIWNKCYDKKEMEILLNDNGFKIVEVFSNTYGDKDFIDNDLLVFACKKI